MQFIDKMGEGGGGSVYPLLHSVPHEAQHRVVFKGLKCCYFNLHRKN